ncbi:MAG: CpaE family protein [Nitratireductor sp.]
MDQVAADTGVSKGNLNDVRPMPRITIQAFSETESVAQTLASTSTDRRMARAHLKVQMGGIPAAVEFYGTAPTPNLVIVESRQTGPELMVSLGRLAEVCDPETKVVVVGHKNDITQYRELISNGVSDYLVAPISMAETMTSIADIFVDPAKEPLGKVIAFMGAKGGVGSSTICHNVAWSVASKFKSEVVLADMDLAFGTANINLDQDPAQGIAEAVFSPERMDDILLDRLLEKCAEHLNLLAAPSTLDRTYDFRQDAFSNILEIAQSSSPVVIVDIPQQWTAWTKSVLQTADEVIITAAPELASLRNAKNIIDALVEIRPNDSTPHLVLNQVGVPKRPEISVSDFIAPLNLQPAAVIPFDPALFGTAANNGQMISESDAKSPIVENFDFLAQLITGKASLKEEKKSPLGVLSRFKKQK